ncbi:hypothetical protein GCM10023353_28610 [Tomitella cavernea]|uniref:Uncharacterized protein n=1 Tax=Tomitella cavernea TaxID=1387982 RepID=A0ABP9CYC6_9ACTN
MLQGAQRPRTFRSGAAAAVLSDAEEASEAAEQAADKTGEGEAERTEDHDISIQMSGLTFKILAIGALESQTGGRRVRENCGGAARQCVTARSGAPPRPRRGTARRG